MLKTLLNNLEVERVALYEGGYLIHAKLRGSSIRFKFFFKESNIVGYSNERWVQLTAATQSLISAKFKQYCINKNI